MLVVIMTGGGADASRESVDATDTRDSAPQVRSGRHRASDCALDRGGAQHSRAHARAGCRSAVGLATASYIDRPGARGDALRQRWPSARLAWQTRVGLDLCPSRAAPAGRYADAAVGGISPGRTRRLRLQPLVRALPRLGGPAVADNASGASGRRANVRRLCRPDYRGDRRPQWGDPPSPDIRRSDGRLQLHLCRGELDADAARLDRLARSSAGLHGRRTGAAGPRQPEGRG